MEDLGQMLHKADKAVSHRTCVCGVDIRHRPKGTDGDSFVWNDLVDFCGRSWLRLAVRVPSSSSQLLIKVTKGKAGGLAKHW